MSADTTLARPEMRGPTATSRVPFLRLARVEFRKMIDTRAGKWLLITIGGLTLIVMVIALLAADAHDLIYSNFADAVVVPQSFLLPVIGILAITSEWSQRTGLVTFTLEPQRARVVSAKFASLIVLGLAFIALALGLAAIGNILGETLRSGSGDWAFGVGGVRDVVIMQLIGLIQGFAFGMLFMNSAAAIVLYFVIPIASSLVFNLVTWLHDHVASWFDLGTAQGPLQSHDMAGNDWRNLLIAVLIWVVLPFVLGLFRLLRSELKSS